MPGAIATRSRTEEGSPEAWLDAATREAIAQFFEQAPATGVIWIREGEVRFIMQDPWPAADGPDIRALLERQGALASALDTTAGKRW